MSFFTSGELSGIVSNPSTIAALYTARRTAYLAALGAGFAWECEEHYKLSFCSLLAHELKPYGSCIVVDLAGLLAAPALDCDNYAILTWRLFDILCPTRSTVVAAVGWNGGAIGNHCQLFFRHPSLGFGMVDPTIGLYQCAYFFDWIASGKACSATYRKSLYARPGSVLDTFNTTVINALANGSYKPSDLLYYATDLETFCSPTPQSGWMTPQAA